MDPISAINLEFVREMREEWSREAPTLEGQAAPQAAHLRLTARLRTTVGECLIAAGMWLKGHTEPLKIDAIDTMVSRR